MFRSLARRLTPARRTVFDVHPLQLSRWLDEAWTGARARPRRREHHAHRGPRRSSATRSSSGRSTCPADRDGGDFAAPSGINPAAPDTFTGSRSPRRHCPALVSWPTTSVYAYLVESTGVFEVLAEVVRRLERRRDAEPAQPGGSQLGADDRGAVLPGPPALQHPGRAQRAPARPAGEPPQRLLADVRARAAAPGPARWLRPGRADGSWKQDVGDGVNSSFREKWTELLRQVWLGIENAKQRDRAQRHRPRVHRVTVRRAARHDGDAAPGRPARSRGVRLRQHAVAGST